MEKKEYYKNTITFKNDSAFLKELSSNHNRTAEGFLDEILNNGRTLKAIKSEKDFVDKLEAYVSKQSKNSYYWYYSSAYQDLNFLSSGVIYSLQDPKSKKQSYRSFIDIIKEKNKIDFNIFAALKEAKKRFAIKKSDDNDNTEAEDEDKIKVKKQSMAILYSIIMTFFFKQEKYRNCISIIEEALKRTPNAAIGMSGNTWSYRNTDSPEYGMSGCREAMCLLVGGLNDEAFKKSSICKSLVEVYDSLFEKYQLKYLDDKTTPYHQLITRKFAADMDRSRVSVLGDSSTEFANAYFGLDMLETNSLELEDVLREVKYRVDHPHSWRKTSINDITGLTELVGTPDLEERLVKILRNYFYSKYGRGQKYSGLSKRLMAAKELMKFLNFECDLLELIADLPEKIQVAALKGEIEE